MITQKGFTTKALEGLAARLGDAGIGRWIPDPDTLYDVDDIAIVTSGLPVSPDQVISLTAYLTADDTVTAVSDVRVQLRFRGPQRATNAANDIADAVFENLHGARYVDLGTGQPAFRLVQRISSLPMGEDKNGRAERVDNYEFSGVRHTPNRPNNHP